MSRLLSVAVIVPLLWLSLSPGAGAAETLRWKLKGGEKLRVAIEQQTTSTVTYSSKPVKTTLEIALETTWTVDSADEKQVKMTQTVDRIQVKMQSGTASPLTYDSAVATPPTGPAKEIAAAVGPLLEPGSAIVLTMTTRGEVLAAEPSAKLAELWKVGVEAKATPGPPLAGKDAAQELLKRTLVLLPEKPVSESSAGKEKWKNQREVEIAIGKVKQTLDYTYGGKVESESRQLDRIDFVSQLELGPGAPKSPKLKLKSQTQTGSALFSASEGRLVSAEQTQKLVTETPYRETIISVTVESLVKTNIAAATP